MNIQDNPFYILGVSPRDNRKQIIAKSISRSLEIDDELCKKARTELLDPKKRLLAELSWFPGATDSEIQQALYVINNEPHLAVNYKHYHNLAYTNIISEVLHVFYDNIDIFSSPHDIDILLDLPYILIRPLSNLELCGLLDIINADRRISLFPDVDMNSIETGVNYVKCGHMRYFDNAMMCSLMFTPRLHISVVLRTLYNEFKNNDKNIKAEGSGMKLALETTEINVSIFAPYIPIIKSCRYFILSAAKGVSDDILKMCKSMKEAKNINIMREQMRTIVKELEEWVELVLPLRIYGQDNEYINDFVNNISIELPSIKNRNDDEGVSEFLYRVVQILYPYMKMSGISWETQIRGHFCGIPDIIDKRRGKSTNGGNYIKYDVYRNIMIIFNDTKSCMRMCQKKKNGRHVFLYKTKSILMKEDLREVCRENANIINIIRYGCLLRSYAEISDRGWIKRDKYFTELSFIKAKQLCDIIGEIVTDNRELQAEEYYDDNDIIVRYITGVSKESIMAMCKNAISEYNNKVDSEYDLFKKGKIIVYGISEYLEYLRGRAKSLKDKYLEHMRRRDESLK